MKNILFLAIALSFAAGAFAQSADPNMQSTQSMPSPAVRAKTSTDKINAIANLTQEQYNQVLQLNNRFYSQVRAGAPARLEAWREQQLKSILGADGFERVQSSGVLQE